VTFTLPGSRYFIISINRINLMVLADPPEAKEVHSGDPNTFSLPASADSSGAMNCTDLLQNLIDSVSAKGGGVAYIPCGTFRVSPFCLKSNVSLYLADGAALKFDTDSAPTTKDFGKVIHHDQERVHPGVYFIKADDAQNIGIAGRGIIDLNGGALFDADGRLDSCMRIQNVRNLAVDGVTIRENSSWSILTAGCRNVSFRNVKLLNGMGFEQNDAFDIISCQDVLIEHCFAYARDDAYCLKGGGPGTHGGGITTRETRDFGNITVQDCVAYTRDGSGFKIGNQSTVSGRNFTCKNLYAIAGRNAVFLALFDGPATFEHVVADNIFIDQKNMIPFKVQIKNGGHVKDVNTSNFFLEMQPITIRPPG
jgi:polygalacturonase